jgi:predicted cobalt transporter CbtA
MTMRFVMMLLGLALMVMAGLWFFTPVLDATYSKHAPGYAHSRSSAPSSAPAGATRGAAPDAKVASRSAGQSGGSGGGISSKALADNVMSMINLGTGVLGALFTYMSYRAQLATRRRRGGRDEV